MSDFTSLKNNLLEIDSLPRTECRITNPRWDLLIKKLKDTNFQESGKEKELTCEQSNFIDRNWEDIFDILIKSVIGISVSRKENRRLLVYIIQVFDHLALYKRTRKKEYYEFRYKAFTLFIDNDYDAEAANLYDHLREIKLSLKDKANNHVYTSISNQLKNYHRRIDKKLRRYEEMKDFNKAQFLNSIYSLHPEYEFEAKLQEKEKSYLRLPFLDVIMEIVLPIVFISVLFGVNQIIDAREDNNLFSFFRKGHFDTATIIVGFFVIYFTFWLFKAIEYSKLTIRQTIFFKVVIMIVIIGSLQWYIVNRYNITDRKFFPMNESKIDQPFDKDDIHVLVTKFTAVEQSSIFDNSYSEINACQLFYKKLLNQKSNLKEDEKENLHFEYSPNCLTIKEEEDFNKIFDQKKYDIVISGDVIKNNGNVNIFTSFYIPDKGLEAELKEVIFPDEYPDPEDNIEVYCKMRFDNIWQKPLEYFDILMHLGFHDKNNQKLIESKYCDSLIGGVKLSIQNYNLNYTISDKFPVDFNFVSSLEKSPAIAFNYINLMKINHEYRYDWEEKKLEEAIISINNMLAACRDSTDTKPNNTEFQIHLLVMKSRLTNEQFLLEEKSKDRNPNNQYWIWLQKTESIGLALEKMLKYNGVNKNDVDYFVGAYWFMSFRLLFDTRLLEHQITTWNLKRIVKNKLHLCENKIMGNIDLCNDCGNDFEVNDIFHVSDDISPCNAEKFQQMYDCLMWFLNNDRQLYDKPENKNDTDEKYYP